MTPCKIDRHCRAKGVANRAEARLQFFSRKTEPFRQSVQRGITRRARAGDAGIALAFSVTGIVDEQECVARIGVTGENRSPIERKRTVTAKRNPKSGGQSPIIPRWNVKRGLLPKRHRVGNFFGTWRQRLHVAFVVQPRMINHRVLLEVNYRDEREEAQADRGESANQDMGETVGSFSRSMHG